MEYKHKYIPNLTCVKVSPTAKGWKVTQTESNGRKPKTITAHYPHIDFHAEKGVWEAVEPTAN